MSTEITRQDVTSVARQINVELTEEQITYVLENYDGAQAADPSGTWNLVVEDLIYQTTL